MIRNAFCSNYIQIQCPYFHHIKQPKFTEIKKKLSLTDKNKFTLMSKKTTLNLSLGLHKKKLEEPIAVSMTSLRYNKNLTTARVSMATIHNIQWAAALYEVIST